MKKILLFSSFAFAFFFLMTISGLISSCQKESSSTPEPPKADTTYFVIEGVEVSNGVVTSLGFNTVKFQGNFKKFQASSFKIIDYGYVISSTTNKPTFENNEGISYEGERSGVGVFESQISGLKENTTYYGRVYLKRQVISSGVIEYGYHPFSISFKTKPVTPPNLINADSQNITSSSFQANAILNDPNLLNIKEYGHIWSKTNPNLDLSNNEGKSNFGTLQSVFTHNFSTDVTTGLTPNTTYFVRAYAKNQYDLIGYSDIMTIKTIEAPKPILTVSNFQNMTGDISPNEIAIIEVFIKNNGNAPSTNTKLELNASGVQFVTSNPIDFGIILPQTTEKRIVKFTKTNILDVGEITFSGNINCTEGDFPASSIFTIQTFPFGANVSDNLLQYFRLNRSPADEINYSLFGNATDTLTVYSPNRIDALGTSLSNGKISNITPQTLQSGINSSTEMTVNFWARASWGHSFFINSGAFEFSSLSFTDNNGNTYSGNSIQSCNTWTNLAGVYPTDNAWHMITIILENDSNGRVIIDSDPINLYSTTFPKEIPSCNFGDKITISTNAYCFIDNFRVYNRKLSAFEIQTLFDLKE